MDPSEEEGTTNPPTGILTSSNQGMDNNAEDTGILSSSPGELDEAGSPVELSGSSGNSHFTDEELNLSGEASKAFAASDISGALFALEALSKLRPSDPSVTHNCILLQFLAKKINLNEFQNALQDALQKDSPEFDTENQGTLLFNLSLCKFFQRQFQQAELHLLKLLEGNHHSSHDESFQKRVYSLLCRIYVITRQGEKLSRCLNDFGSSSDPSSHFFKVQSLLLSKNHKAFKKDLKESSSSFQDDDAYSLTFEFLRANMEYIKGNPRKAHKLLSNIEVENGNLEMDSFHHNNVGVVHIMQEKPNLASHYLQTALEKTNKLFEENDDDHSQNKIPEYLLKNKKIEITYNLAIALLNSGTYTELSFEYFVKTLPMYQKRPSLWLHMAECCIQSYQQLHAVSTYSDSVASTKDVKHKSTTLTSIGPIQHQKIVLNDSGGNPFTHPGVSLPVPLNPPKNKNLNLDFALSCLRNASVFSKMNNSKQESLHAAILVNHSYVCLLQKDFVTAFSKAEEVLDFLVSVSSPIRDISTYKLLGHLYAGEALIYLDRISEATVHLGPTTLQSLDSESTSPAGDESEDNNGSRKGGPYGGLGFSALNFNLSVAFALRGELDKAKGVLDKSTGPKSVELATKITMMNLYIHIMKKDVKTCREIIQENCDVVKMPFTAQAK